MAYPILPITLTWNTSHNYTARVNQSRYKSGVDQRDRMEINLITEDIDVQAIVGDREYAALQYMLDTLRGRPFRLRPENAIPNAPNQLYTCAEWSWQRLGYGGLQFQAKFQQVRVLNIA